MRASNETGVGKRGTRAEMFDKISLSTRINTENFAKKSRKRFDTQGKLWPNSKFMVLAGSKLLPSIQYNTIQYKFV